jgi:hypothetical protein
MGVGELYDFGVGAVARRFAGRSEITTPRAADVT